MPFHIYSWGNSRGFSWPSVTSHRSFRGFYVFDEVCQRAEWRINEQVQIELQTRSTAEPIRCIKKPIISTRKKIEDKTLDQIHPRGDKIHQKGRSCPTPASSAARVRAWRQDLRLVRKHGPTNHRKEGSAHPSRQGSAYSVFQVPSERRTSALTLSEFGPCHGRWVHQDAFILCTYVRTRVLYVHKLYSPNCLSAYSFTCKSIYNCTANVLLAAYLSWSYRQYRCFRIWRRSSLTLKPTFLWHHDTLLHGAKQRYLTLCDCCCVMIKTKLTITWYYHSQRREYSRERKR